jgi:hypothetical protein
LYRNEPLTNKQSSLLDDQSSLSINAPIGEVLNRSQ